MAAEALINGGVAVDLYDVMPSVGRKFLIAGKGGMNLTHSEPREQFLSRYGTRRAQLEPLLNAFGPEDLRAWAHGLGIETFIGTSRRVFPVDMKAAPLLRVWLHRLREAGVRFHMRHRWYGWNADGTLRFATPQGIQSIHADAVVLALGGGSWARLGSDGAWVPLLAERGVHVEALQPANCGFDIGWSDHFRERYAGQALKAISINFTGSSHVAVHQQGELMITDSGVEGGVIYALSGRLRDEITASGYATIHLDLAPGRELPRLIRDLSRPRGSHSMAKHLRRAGIEGVKAGLLRERVPTQIFEDPSRLAAAIKALPLTLIAPRPIDEAISSAGGVAFDALDEHLMIRSLPGVFCAGEMLDWEAPTGGYLFTASFASGHAAGLGVIAWLNRETT